MLLWMPAAAAAAEAGAPSVDTVGVAIAAAVGDSVGPHIGSRRRTLISSHAAFAASADRSSLRNSASNSISAWHDGCEKGAWNTSNKPLSAASARSRLKLRAVAHRMFGGIEKADEVETGGASLGDAGTAFCPCCKAAGGAVMCNPSAPAEEGCPAGVTLSSSSSSSSLDASVLATVESFDATAIADESAPNASSAAAKAFVSALPIGVAEADTGHTPPLLCVFVLLLLLLSAAAAGRGIARPAGRAEPEVLLLLLPDVGTDDGAGDEAEADGEEGACEGGASSEVTCATAPAVEVYLFAAML